MTHAIHDRKKLTTRVSRIRGQLEAVTRALDREADCGSVLRLIASARGALDGLMAEVLEGHIREHAFHDVRAQSARGQAAEDLIGIVRAYLK